jgi:anthranilate phosphoribosyltransferase
MDGMGMKQLIALVTEGRDLSRAQAEAAMSFIMDGQATPAQMAAFLVALRMKGETVEEILGFAGAMRDRAAAVSHRRRVVVDTCGTGGDGSGIFNVSTCAAFVVAGAGVAVAKHGNRAASSLCGSADVLEALGVEVALPPEGAARCIDEIGIGFLYAPVYHPCMKNVVPVRKEIGLRTVFNLLGPLTNPAGVQGQVVGVFSPVLTEPLARVLGHLGVRHALVVHGLDGIDEVSLSAPTLISEYLDGYVTTYRVCPEDLGLPRAPRDFLLGGSPEENARILESVLKGEPGPRRDVVVGNAAAALVAAGLARTLRDAVPLATQAIDSGMAYRKLQELRRLSAKLGQAVAIK